MQEFEHAQGREAAALAALRAKSEQEAKQIASKHAAVTAIAQELEAKRVAIESSASQLDGHAARQRQLVEQFTLQRAALQEQLQHAEQVSAMLTSVVATVSCSPPTVTTLRQCSELLLSLRHKTLTLKIWLPRRKPWPLCASKQKPGFKLPQTQSSGVNMQPRCKACCGSCWAPIPSD